MGKRIFIIFLLSCSFLSAGGSKRIIRYWESYQVIFQRLKSGSKAWKIEFKDKYYGTVLKTEVLSNHLIKFGAIKMDKRSVFFVISHNGGDKKEGSYNVYIYYKGEYGIYSGKVYGLSGHDSPDFSDINRDGQSELKISNTMFTQFVVKHKSLGLCHLTEGKHTGITGLYPKYYSLKDGNFRQVTFKPEYYKNLLPYFIETEKWMKENKDKVLHMGYFKHKQSLRFIEVMQYYYYLTRLGSENRALEQIKKSNLQVKIHSCEKKRNSRVQSPTLPLVSFLKVFRQEVLWGD
ncbi:MAG: hypothetical protein AAF518_12580 [Spirochaetota bacterium]